MEFNIYIYILYFNIVMLDLNEKKYYEKLDILVESTLKSVLNEYEFKQHDDWDSSRGTDYKNTLKSDDYTINYYGPYHSKWRVVKAHNGLMGWQNVKGGFHPIMNDIGWLDSCSDFTGNANSGTSLFNKHKNFATGVKNSVKYVVFPNGEYERDENAGKDIKTDKYGDQTVTDRFADHTLNHDHTYTTYYIQANDITRNPNGRFDPNRLIRYSTTNPNHFKKFCLVWGRFCDENNIPQQNITGYNEHTDEYFVDIHNGPGIYNHIVQIDRGLTNGSIQYKEIDRDAWDSKYQNTEYNLYEGLDEIVRLQIEDFEDNNAEPEPEPMDTQEQENEDYPKEIDGGTGTISFGNNIEEKPEEEPEQEPDNDNGNNNSNVPPVIIPTGGSRGERTPEGGESLYNETITVYYRNNIKNENNTWKLNPNTNEWIDAKTGQTIGKVKVSSTKKGITTFKLVTTGGNIYTFSGKLEISREGVKYANDWPIYYVPRKDRTATHSQDVGLVSLKYNYDLRQDLNMFAENIYKSVLKMIFEAKEPPEPFYSKKNDLPMELSDNYWSHNEEINIGDRIGARRELKKDGKIIPLTINGKVTEIKPSKKDGTPIYKVERDDGSYLWIKDTDVTTRRKNNL